MMTHLPPVTPEELAHSESLASLIRAEIIAHGPMPFARFMELALYAPGLGYYSAGLTKFGQTGDFVTAPELGSLFARCVARSIIPVLDEIPSATILELGPGSGALAADLLQELDQLNRLPVRYWMLERSADLRQRQRETLTRRCPQFLDRVEWLDAPPSQPWQGIVLANEVVDALPVTRFALLDDTVFLEHVDLAPDGSFVLCDQPAAEPIRTHIESMLATLPEPLPRPYRSEFLPELKPWFITVTEQLQQGLVLFSDYGYPRHEFYLPQRRDGTLICHYRHRAHDKALLLPGLQDLTAFVDFTALAEAGSAAGFYLAGYTNQGQFLLASGLPELLDQAHVLPNTERWSLIRQAKRLTLPNEMGERFQMMAWLRGLALSLPAFSVDHRHRL